MKLRGFVVGLVSLLVVGAGLSVATHAGPAVPSSDAGVWTYTWSTTEEAGAQLHLNTNIPTALTGANVAEIIGADVFHNSGFDGSGTVSSNIEAGHIWGEHETLTHVTSFTNHPDDAYADPHRHATQVGMMIGGRQTQGGGVHQEGIAPETDLRSAAIATSGWGGGTTFNLSVATLAYALSSTESGFGTADVINASWGATHPSGDHWTAQIPDALAYDNPGTTFVVAAGNSGPGTNTVLSPGSGYNNITVGALQNDGDNNYDAIAEFSSRGPQAYWDPVNGTIAAGVARRGAVDIVAPGTNLVSAHYDVDNPGATNLYASPLSGTSYSAPIVAGGVALMHDAARQMDLPDAAHDARVIKANLLNAAWKPDDYYDNANGNNVADPEQALHFTYGAGALDLGRTYTQYLTGQTDIEGMDGGTTSEVIGWDFARVDLGDTTDVVISTPLAAGSEFRATLTWFRERNYIEDDDTVSVLEAGFANLDLQVWDSEFSTLYAESIDTYTPVEHLVFDLPTTGLYGLRVVYSENIFGEIDSADFALAWWGEAGIMDPPPVHLIIPEPGSLTLLAFGLVIVKRRRRR